MTHVRADDLDPAEVAATVPPARLKAVHEVEVAAEWVERAFGSLLDAHHETGHAQGLLLDAAQALEEAGLGSLAAQARSVAALDAVHDRWTYQVVDEFRTHLLAPVSALDEDVRTAVTGGVRHCYEADQKRRTEGAVSGTGVRAPSPGPGR